MFEIFKLKYFQIKDTSIDNEDKYSFNPRLIDQSNNPLSNEGIVFRPLRSDDYEKGKLQYKT